MQKGHHGGELEEGELDGRPPQTLADFLGERDHGVLRNPFFADPDSLAKVAEVRRREQADAQTLRR